MTARPPLRVDIVVPMYNEERGAARFHAELQEALGGLPHAITVYYVDDGSTDATASVLATLAAGDARVVVVGLTRNFGHQAALTAGLDLTAGDVVITLDGDGQHPPHLIPEMLRLFESGYEVVLTQRDDASTTGFLKGTTANVFYGLLRRISQTPVLRGSADFRLLARPVVDAVKGMRESHRFLRGMIGWLGYRTVILPYAERRRFAGRSKYSLRRMVRFAGDAIFSFSLVPLQIALAAGAIFMILAMLEVAYVLHFWLRGQQHRLVPGWSSLMLAVLLVGGVVMLGLGVIGIYVGYIFQEVKRRPIYVIRSIEGPREEK